MKIHNIAVTGILCDVPNMKISCNLILAALYNYIIEFNTTCIMNICFSSKFALRIPSALSSFRPAIRCALLSLFPSDFFIYLFIFAVSKQKPIQIIETVKKIGRYLIRYAHNQVYDSGLSICK